MSEPKFDAGASAAAVAKTVKWDVHYHTEIPSTNTWAKQNSDKFKGQSLVVASLQTAGRGRGTHQWSDVTSGANLLSSWVLPLSQPPTHLVVPRAGLAVYRALRVSFPQLNPALKAPNDIYVNGKKLAGLLIENIQEGTNNCLIIGLGVNIQSAPQLTGPIQATCLADELPQLSEEMFKTFIVALTWQFKMIEMAFNSVASTLAEYTSQHAALSLDEQQELLYALNQLKPTEPYLQVLPDGSLKKASGLIPWQSL